MTESHLAIETSGRHGSVAMMRQTLAIETVQLSQKLRTAVALAPEIDRLLVPLREVSSNLKFVGVSVGPGSFTGVRIGVITAKTLAYSLQIPVVPVDTLAVVADQVFRSMPAVNSVLVGLNAYRNQVFVRHASRDQPGEAKSQVWSFEKWEKKVATLPPKTCIAGNLDCKKLPNGIIQATGKHRNPSSEGCGRLAWNLFHQDRGCDPFKVKPEYLRPSAAEEKVRSES